MQTPVKRSVNYSGTAFEGLSIGDIKHDQNGVCPPVIRLGDRPEPLLPSSVPCIKKRMVCTMVRALKRRGKGEDDWPGKEGRRKGTQPGPSLGGGDGDLTYIFAASLVFPLP